jgi:hypothetical protein
MHQSICVEQTTSETGFGVRFNFPDNDLEGFQMQSTTITQNNFQSHNRELVLSNYYQT